MKLLAAREKTGTNLHHFFKQSWFQQVSPWTGQGTVTVQKFDSEVVMTKSQLVLSQKIVIWNWIFTLFRYSPSKFTLLNLAENCYDVNFVIFVNFVNNFVNFVNKFVPFRYYHCIQEVSFTLLLCRAFPLAVYSLVVFFERYHLFIWSVFSPKLLYEGSHLLVVTFVLLFLQFDVIFVQYFRYSRKGSPKTI